MGFFAPIPAGFDDSKYKCCCDCMHIKVGTLVIGIIEIVGLVLNLIQGCVTGVLASVIFAVLGFIICGLSIVLMIYGLHVGRPGFLIFRMVMQIITIILLSILLAAVIVILALGADSLSNAFSSNNSSLPYTYDMLMGLAIAGVVIYAICLALEIWFFVIVSKCRGYLSNLNNFRTKNVQVVAMVQPQHIPPPAYIAA